MRPLYIFDLDGTLALIDHRRHLVEGDKKDWRAFFAACVDDEPNTPILTIFNSLVMEERMDRDANEVWIFSGRSDEVRAQTIQWLDKWSWWFVHGIETGCAQLKMRKAGDYTPDEVLKKQWLNAMLPEDRARLVCVFDERDKVVRMWRAAGVTCCQVAEGAF